MAGPAEVGVLDPAVLRQARGAFFTPPVLCEFLAAWAVRSSQDRVLEPSGVHAAVRLASAGVEATVWLGDFFGFAMPGRYEAVIGNLPCVRRPQAGRYPSLRTGDSLGQANLVASRYQSMRSLLTAR